MPFARRRASRRRPKLAESSTSSNGTSTTAHSRREIHNRAISVDASVPLLEHGPVTSPEFGSSRLGSITALSDTATQSSPPYSPNADSLHIPRRFAPKFKSFSARSPSPDLEPGLSRPLRPSPPQPLRHARTRIAHMPMDPLPEDLATDVLPQRVPSPTSTESHAPASTTWLHIPKAPLIGAFRGSISSLTSAASSSLHTIQHYPSFSRNAQSASASSRSSQTFYSVDSSGPTAARHNLPASEHGEFHPSGVAARFKPGGVGERIPQLHLGASEGGICASRQASMVNSPSPSITKGLRSNGRPVSSTVASGSSLSLYTDARSQLGGGEDGKTGSVGGSSSGGRGRQS